MKITYKGDYALKAVLDLSVNYGKGVVTINDMAKRIDVPIKFLEQVLLELKKGGFVDSKRGKIGGYYLAKAPLKITVGDVIKFIEGPIEPIACVKDNYGGCKDMYKCAFREVWRKVFRATSEIVDNVTFEELVYKVKPAEEIYSYSI
ncbi:MAG TPA: Rrf2 family transcriptional regulator [Candidatus Omnitrophota bacterium]|nr:Rrf2 family transcriptional regulator [Candidatus Omnitrophota bacterium]HPS19371.1 Rrf2 family transcriptional regulator [Candidatus Omnitrophota bacterium]